MSAWDWVGLVLLTGTPLCVGFFAGRGLFEQLDRMGRGK